MQFIVTPRIPQTVEAGHQLAELPLADQPFQMSLHTIAPSTSATWIASPAAPLLVVLEGIGKVTIDGAPQRFSGPCALCVPAGAEVRISNQGGMSMRLLSLAPK
jgi:quercetin dioxygenase-like cupin family protein